MKTKNTPGPWTLAMNYSEDAHIIGTNDGVIARVIRSVNTSGIGKQHTESTQKANARLISAAPEMLEALREIEAGCVGYQPGHVDATMNRTKSQIAQIARAAIAKAEGTS